MKRGVSEETVWAIVEAYLFETGKAASLEELRGLFKGLFSAEELEATLTKMERNCWKERRGIVLIVRKGLWALEIRGNSSLLEKWSLKKDEGLPPEEWSEREKTILAVIAYEGPVSLDRIDQIMGSECSHLVILLQERGLVKKRGGKVEVTPSFYAYFGLKDSQNLPKIYAEELKEAPSKSEDFGFNFYQVEKSLEMEKNVSFDPAWSFEI